MYKDISCIHWKYTFEVMGCILIEMYRFVHNIANTYTDL